MDINEKVSGPGGASQKSWIHVNSSGDLPIEMRFNHGQMVAIVVYSILMVVSAAGNLTVFTQLVMRRRAGRASRLDLLLMHLATADLLVTFLMMPLEIAWAATVEWRAGDFLCRFMMFNRVYGLYLSSFILICIALDRYYAIVKPLNVLWESRVKKIIALAWVAAAVASLPQSLIFHVSEHPEIKGYYQCVTFGSLPTRKHMLAYFIMNITLMYVAPLMSTLYCSTAVVMEIIKRAHSDEKMRRSGVGILDRAKARTLKMSITILIVFFTCWTPYYCYCIWFWTDPDSASKVDPALQKGLWIFSCTNSCANPIVYGIFNRNRWHWRGDAIIHNRCQSLRRDSRLTNGGSMEISVSALQRVRYSSSSDRNSRRGSNYSVKNGLKPASHSSDASGV